jgi:hypothetical protein
VSTDAIPMDFDNVAADKRGARRYRIEGLEGRIALVTQVEIVNISLSGVALKIDRRFNLGSECTLRLQQGEDGLSVKGIVVWSALVGFRKNGEESSPEYSVGMRFSEILDAPSEAFLDLINQNKAFKAQQLAGSVDVSGRGRAMADRPRLFQVKLISPSGMLIEMDTELDIGESYVMIMRLEEQAPIHVTGKICSQFELAPDLHEIGVEFTDMSAADILLLKVTLMSLTGDNAQ